MLYSMLNILIARVKT